MDLSIIAILLSGLGLGFIHSLDPDHVVAMTALVCNNKNIHKSIASATVWGIGHSAVLLIAGFALLILRVTIPENIVDAFEFAAAILLIVLGIYVLRPLGKEIIHRRQHKAGVAHNHTQSHTHSHHHMHILPNAHAHGEGDENHKHLHKSALTGVLQGLGGTAALMLVTLTTVNTLEMGLGFILVFGIGVVLGMVAIVSLLGSIIAYTATRLEKVHRIIIVVTGSLSIAFGIGIILSILV
jgi:ABC-type nickel/cobalt efflux system permease component RcnA